jgi:hypothetical protein
MADKTKQINMIQLAEKEVCEIVTPKVEIVDKEQLLKIRGELTARLAFIDDILSRFKSE